ncbi:MAG: hypothetical protein J0G32_01985 [Alphaproteobacteria bacterium]|nr:hypothetical protein [Alphaproteobacteria bacterium]OJV16250.1 MAG: hypothetical protein BGO27_04495 [Alphaproteobacteria bacterium 33-17]
MLRKIILGVMLSKAAMANSFENAGEEINPSREHLLSISFSHNIARALHIAAEHKIADKLESEPKLLEELAEELHVNKDVLYRIMKVLVTHDVFDYTEDRKFKINDHSRFLLSSHPHSLRTAIAKEMDLRRWNSLGNLEISLRSGKPSFDMLYEESFYEYLENNSGAKARFDAGMSDYSVGEDIAIAKSFPFNKYDTVIDVGGNQGSLIYQILKNHKKVEGVLFDMPNTIQNPRYLINKNMEHRYEIIGGDFFEKVPEGGDVYILKRIIHNWDDERAVKILKNCVKNLDRKGRILIVDVIDEDLSPQTKPSPFVDAEISSIVLNRGAERSLTMFEALCKKAGLKIVKVHRPNGIKVGIIEAAKL